MARKREPVDPNPGQRLLGPALKRLQGASARRSNLALDILTGRTTAPARDQPLEVPATRREGEAAVGTARASAAIPSTVRDQSVAQLAAQDGGTIVPSPRENTFTHQRGATTAPRRRRLVVARTVYLSDQDVTDIDFIVRAWRRRVHKRVSRSEVLRQAIGNLRDAVELGAAPRVLEREKEESKRDG